MKVFNVLKENSCISSNYVASIYQIASYSSTCKNDKAHMTLPLKYEILPLDLPFYTSLMMELRDREGTEVVKEGHPTLSVQKIQLKKIVFKS